jgi:hypothetical protein
MSNHSRLSLTEREALFGTRSRFRILAVEKAGDSAVIDMEQV